MINRRHIRVKVMQSVYAMLQSNSDNLVKEEKFLLTSIDRMYDLYVLSLSILVNVQEMAANHLEISKKKYLASLEDKKPNTKFIDNQLISILKESYSIQNYLEDRHLNNWKNDNEFIRVIWDLIQKSETYAKYIATKESGFTEDKEFVIAIFKDVIAPNEKLADYFEDQNISWVDDIPFVNTWVVKSLNAMSATKPFVLGELYKDKSDQEFVLELFRKVILNHEKYDEEINEKTPNWDTERIADIDLILIKMALSEFLHFPSIPTRVSINEYIEISKDYSSQKSSFFINGVLDKLMKQYTASKRIKKIGRGLL
ncbi:MAG: transcription antitermination factor NusB [Flavobacteriaceae bacterium]|nr:transcription antitermination factor NusB [Flavobacteriaceae bacterium]